MQGHYIAAPDAGPWSRVMALILASATAHCATAKYATNVRTGNSVYRKAALVDVGLFDETLGYGYDNDMSYRLARVGYRLAFRADVKARTTGAKA